MAAASPQTPPRVNSATSRHAQYEAAKRRWLAKNPGASAEQIEDAFIVLARRMGV